MLCFSYATTFSYSQECWNVRMSSDFDDFFPRTARHTEVAVGRGLSIDGAAQVETFDDGLRAEIEILCHDVGQIFSFLVECFYHDGLRATDSVGDRYERFLGIAVGDQILSDETAHVRGRAVHFHRLLTGETSSAVRHKAAICVYLYLPAGKPRVRLEAALHESPRRIDEYLDIFHRAEYRCKKMFDELFPYFLLRDFFVVLCRTECCDDFAF